MEGKRGKRGERERKEDKREKARDVEGKRASQYEKGIVYA